SDKNSSSASRTTVSRRSWHRKHSSQTGEGTPASSLRAGGKPIGQSSPSESSSSKPTLWKPLSLRLLIHATRNVPAARLLTLVTWTSVSAPVKLRSRVVHSSLPTDAVSDGSSEYLSS